jgi:hypothetical protein
MENNMKNKLLELPIDVYTRHYIATDVVNTIVRKGKNKLSILDVGGYKGWTSTFFSSDDVTVLDIYDSKDKNYVKGDATANSYSDNTFDVVTSFDVFEHIPRAKREEFITESFRVSKSLSIMTMPTDIGGTHKTRSAEVNLNMFFKGITGKDHPWLKEHIEYGIPTDHEVEEILNKKSLIYRKIGSNDLDMWQIIETMNFLGTVDQSSLDHARSMNSVYNTNAESLEYNVQNPYRTIFIVFKDVKLARSFDQYMKTKTTLVKTADKAKNEIHRILQAQIALFVRDISERDKKIVTMQKKVDHYKVTLDEYQSKIEDMKNSKSWKITKPLRSLKRRAGMKQ